MSAVANLQIADDIQSDFELEIEPFDLQQSLDGGQAFGWYETSDVDTYRGVLGDNVLTISCDGARVSFHVENRRMIDSARIRLEDYLGATQDIVRLRSALSSEPSYGELLWKRPLIRVLRQEPWECLAAFICSQNSNIPRIKQMVASVARLGRRIGSDSWAYAFPEPRLVANAGEAELRSIGLGYRAKHLAPTAAMLTNPQWLKDLRNATYPDAKRALVELPGVGPKVADCVLAYSLDKGEAFPVDVHIRRAAIRLYGLDDDIKNEAVGEWARDRFGEYAAWAQLYMFRDEINRRLTN